MGRDGSPAAPARRLVLDARPSAIGSIDPTRQLLGLPLIRRAVLAARRCGFETITVLADPDAQTTLASAVADQPGVTVGGSASMGAQGDSGENGGAVLYAPADILAEHGWLTALAAEPVAADECRSADGGIVLCGAGTVLETDPPPTANGKRVHLEPPPLRVTSEADLRTAERRLLGALVKKTDGVTSRYFARPISLFISRRLANTRITPNGITVVSMLIGLAAAPFFLSASPVWQTIGALLFVLHSVVDGCDGELARLKYMESRLGGLLDFWSDNAVHIAVFGCMAVGWHLAVGAAWPLYLGAAAVIGAGGSAFAVYWFTLRQKRDDGPVYTSVSQGPSQGLTRLLDDLSRRDFIYLVLALSLFGKASWFLALTAAGAPVFLTLVLVVATRDARRRRAG